VVGVAIGRQAELSDAAPTALESLRRRAGGQLDPGVGAAALSDPEAIQRPRADVAARGLSNAEIAARLVVSPRTVQHHLAHIYDKTGRRTRAGAAIFAMEHGLVHAGG
jgi:DNA-binding NarL/FixJ family response regulator